MSRRLVAEPVAGWADGPIDRHGIMCPMADQVAGAAARNRLGYRPELDGLRAVALIFVLGVHWWPHDLPGGRIGVDLFFVMSGFLITSLMLEHGGRFSLLRFYERRARRLLPAVVVLLGVFWWAEGAHWVALYVGNWARAAGELHPYLGHMWSLAIEEQFYIVWPLVFLALRTCRRWVAVAALVALAGAVGLHRVTSIDDSARIVNGTDMRLDGLALGCALAFGWPWLRGVRWLPVAARVAAVPCLLALCWVWRFDADLLGWGYTLVSAGWLVVLVAVLTGSGTVLKHPVMVRLGVLSYSLYLWHFPISAWVRGGSLYNTAPVTTVVAVVLSSIAAVVSYRFVEQRFRLARPCEQHAEQPAVVGEGVGRVGGVTDRTHVEQLARGARLRGEHPGDLQHVL